MLDVGTQIPSEVLLRILSFLSGIDLLRCAQVNRQWNWVTYLLPEAVLFRRFPKTYRHLKAHERKELRKIEDEAYRYLKRLQIDFINSAKDGDEVKLIELIENGNVSFDDLFCLDEKEMTFPLEVIRSKSSQAVRNKTYQRLIKPRCDGPLELLLWAIRSFQTLDTISQLWEAEQKEQASRNVKLLLCAFLKRQSLNETRRVEYRKNQNIDDGRTPLLEACMYGHFEAVKFLVSRGESVNRADHLGCTPLFETCRWEYLEIAIYLLENGSQKDINRPNNFGRTPLSESVRWENLPITLLLIKNGADVTCLDPEAQEKLLFLLRNSEKSVDTFLVEKMIETYLKRKGIEGKFAAKCLLNVLRTRNKNHFVLLDKFHEVLTGQRLKIIYDLSKPFLEEIRRESNLDILSVNGSNSVEHSSSRPAL